MLTNALHKYIRMVVLRNVKNNKRLMPTQPELKFWRNVANYYFFLVSYIKLMKKLKIRIKIKHQSVIYPRKSYTWLNMNAGSLYR